MKPGFVILGAIVILAGIYVLTGGNSRSPSDDQGSSSNLSFTSLKGKTAPNFKLTSYDGKTYSLSQFRGKKVLLFFNEGIMCYPACWNQIAALGKDSKLNSGDSVTLSIVPDSREQWVEAVQKMPELGKETILLDPDNTVSAKYGVLNLSSSMHKGSKPGHTYIIIDKNGVIRYTYDDMNMGIHNDSLIKELSKV